MTPFKKLVFPLVLLVLAILLRPKMVLMYSDYGQLFEWLPYLGFGSAIVLAAFFNLARSFTLSASMLAAYVVIQVYLQTTLDEPSLLFTYSALSCLFPLLVLILLFIREKGLRNRHGLLVFSILPLLGLITVTIYYLVPQESLMQSINWHMNIRPVPGYILSINSSLFYLLVMVCALFRLNKTNDDFIAVGVSTLVYTYITLAFFDQVKISTILFIAISIILLINLLRSSYNLAYRDDLTGLLGRRALNVKLKGLGKKYVIAMTDVDHFKKFNDNYGHDIGDDVLKMVAKKIDDVKGGGTSYRYGGEEFCILFPGKMLEECEPFLEVVRKSVENYRMTVRNVAQRPKTREVALERRGRRTRNRDNKTVSVTISIGAAEKNDNNRVPEEVLKAADKALYKAKEKGRNCVIMADN